MNAFVQNIVIPIREWVKQYVAEHGGGGGGAIISTDTAKADLEFADEEGNALVRFLDGHIKTKYFSSKSEYYGKRIAAFGDSITFGYNSTKKWLDLLATDLQATAINYAVSGSSVDDMTDAVESADSNADLIFFWGGTNDWALDNLALGNMYSNTSGTKIINVNESTFYGRVATACKTLLSKYPSKDIYVITPLHRGTYKNQYANDLTPNTQGLYLEQYVQAIKEVCAYYSINVIDMWSASGMNPNESAVADAYFNHSDGGARDLLHPDVNGHKRIAKLIKKHI